MGRREGSMGTFLHYQYHYHKIIWMGIEEEE